MQSMGTSESPLRRFGMRLPRCLDAFPVSGYIQACILPVYHYYEIQWLAFHEGDRIK
jgi:hypothetical protein